MFHASRGNDEGFVLRQNGFCKRDYSALRQHPAKLMEAIDKRGVQMGGTCLLLSFKDRSREFYALLLGSSSIFKYQDPSSPFSSYTCASSP